jgi:hypothetical protein
LPAALYVLAGDASVETHRRQQRGAGDADLCVGFTDARHGSAKIVIRPPLMHLANEGTARARMVDRAEPQRRWTGGRAAALAVILFLAVIAIYPLLLPARGNVVSQFLTLYTTPVIYLRRLR